MEKMQAYLKRKWFYVLIAAVATWLGYRGYKRFTQDDDPLFLPGIYVCTAGNEFCHIVDTLTIRRISVLKDSYRITRRSSFQRIKQGVELPLESEEDEWQADYDAVNMVLVSPGNTRMIFYSPGKNKVTKDAFDYLKIE